MTEATKHQIVERIRAILIAKGSDGHPLSQRKWGDQQSPRISNATVSNALAGKWDLIAPKMWRRLGAAVGHTATEWALAKTRDFELLMKWLSMAQANSRTMALAFEPGSGKSETMEHYANSHANVVLLKCADHWTKHHFLRTLYQGIGHDPKELTGVELAEGIVRELRKLDHPLVIMDELDKLPERCFMYIIDLYNKLDGICGFFFAGAPYLKDMVEKRASRDKRGFREIYSRFGRKFLELHGMNRKDLGAICAANGLVDEDEITSIWNQVQEHRDIRRVKRLVEAHMMQEQAT